MTTAPPAHANSLSPSAANPPWRPASQDASLTAPKHILSSSLGCICAASSAFSLISRTVPFKSYVMDLEVVRKSFMVEPGLEQEGCVDWWGRLRSNLRGVRASRCTGDLSGGEEGFASSQDPSTLCLDQEEGRKGDQASAKRDSGAQLLEPFLRWVSTSQMPDRSRAKVPWRPCHQVHQSSAL